jgi:phosphate:Na+ symporter
MPEFYDMIEGEKYKMLATLKAILSLIAGAGVFLIACGMLSVNLESLGGGKLKKLFAKMSDNRLLGVGIGTAATAAIQSSSATTVMVIGFVNAGIMSLAQAATVIFGANIGTTITGQIVALGLTNGGALSPSAVLATLAGVGAFILAFAKKDSFKKIGGAIAGFGMIFVGLSLMSGAMSSFAAEEGVKIFLTRFSNPLLLVLIGALLTAVIQSSSAMTSLAITMVVAGLISLDQGVYITMGSNVGTCVTALLAGLSGGTNAKRTALIHLIFNVSGVVLFLLFALLLGLFGTGYGNLLRALFPSAPQLQLAFFHTVFNVVTVIFVLPLTSLLTRVVTKLLPEKPARAPDTPRLHYIDENMLKTPPVAAGQVKNEVVRMAGIAKGNFCRACRMACSLDFAEEEPFRADEKELDYLHGAIASFIAKLLESELSERDRNYLLSAFRSISDLERVGDYAENIVEYAEGLREEKGHFSPAAEEEIGRLCRSVEALYTAVMRAYAGERSALDEAYRIEEQVDNLAEEMAQNHIRRLSAGTCTPAVGAKYLSLTQNAERVADHFLNVAKTIA